MENTLVSTPFGRRAMSLGMLARQKQAEKIEPGMARNKWKLLRAVCEARPALGITDRSLTVLDALLTFYPSDEITEERGLVVFPSNAQLSIRAKGMTPATLRRHLAGLVAAGLIIRKDSPNGKRYARRDSAGEVNDAFGFSLAPLLARALEIEELAARAIADRELLRVMKERLTLCRRDAAKLIETGLEEGIAGNWSDFLFTYRSIIQRIPRSGTIETLSPILEQMAELRANIVNHLELNINSKKMDANESQNEQHIQNSNTKPISDFEQHGKKVLGERSGPSVSPVKVEKTVTEPEDRSTPLKSFPLSLVLQACPEILAYGPGGTIKNWRDLMTAAVVVRSMLGVSPSAYEEASSAMGPENAATVIACILERGGHINSAGGYLRDLSRRTQKREFAIGPMLMSLARANSGRSKSFG